MSKENYGGDISKGKFPTHNYRESNHPKRQRIKCKISKSKNTECIIWKNKISKAEYLKDKVSNLKVKTSSANYRKDK